VSQLLALLTPFSGKLVKPPAKGKFGSYVSHYVIEQRLLGVVGAYGWRIVQTVRDADGTLTGCVGELTCEVDGREVTVAGSGDVENPQNAHTDGARLKLAESDAFKRAAMRLGVGLHLWAGDEFYVYEKLKQSDGAIPSQGDPASGAGESPSPANREAAA
jgi:hypothetical protein